MTAPRVTVHTIGRDGEPVAVIENFAADPEALRGAARAAAFVPAGEHYPGVRAPVPGRYLADQRALLATVLREVFAVAATVKVLDVGFALVTTPPAALRLEQRMPHVDALAPGRLALVHFLVPGGDDGTGFFRHRGTGYETLDGVRSGTYLAALDRDLRRHGPPPPAYPDGDTPLFERTAHFGGVYNRALLYRGRLLHSGAIAPGHGLSADPATGRLTITGFFAAA